MKSFDGMATLHRKQQATHRGAPIIPTGIHIIKTKG
jgi:hypothetical protein